MKLRVTLTKLFSHPLTFILTFFLLLYFPIVFSYFQQDEWRDFGNHVFALSYQSPLSYFGYLLQTGIPLTFSYNFINYYFFGVQNTVSAFVVLTLIVLNSLFWFHNIKKISQSSFIAAGSLLFGYVSYLSVQAVTWVIPAISTQGAFLCINMSIFFLLRYQEHNRWRDAGFMILAAAMAPLFRNNGFMIFVCLPFFAFVLSKEYSWGQFFKSLKLFLVLVGVALFMLFSRTATSQVGSGRFVSSKSQVLINTVLLPLKSLSQLSLSDPQIMYTAIRQGYIRYYQKQPDDLTAQTILTDFTSVAFSLALIVFFLASYTIHQRNRKLLFFSLGWYVASFAPYVFDRFSTGTGFLESRYYYLGAFGFGLFVFLYLSQIQSRLRTVIPPQLNTFLKLLVLAIPAVWLTANTFWITSEIQLRNSLTLKRKEVLAFIKDEFGNELDKDFTIFIQEKNTPNSQIKNLTGSYFQTGLLYPVLIYNYSNGNIPAEVFKDETFWDMHLQKIIKTPEYEIGIFYEYPEIRQAVLKGELLPSNVLAIEFDYQPLNNPEARGDVTDFRYVNYKNSTQEIRTKLEQELERNE